MTALLLLLAGAFLSVGVTLLVEGVTNWLTATFVSAFLICSVTGLGWASAGIRGLRRTKRKVLRCWLRSIGVLNDCGWDEKAPHKVSSWSHSTSPPEWKTIVNSARKPGRRAPKLKARLSTLTRGLDGYHAILNPYGGTYPEVDTIATVNLDRIFSYVANGGLFVNAADVPGYWMFSAQLETKIDATPAVYGVMVDNNQRVQLVSGRPFERTPLLERLGVRVINVEGVGEKYSWSHSTCGFTVEQTTGLSVDRLAFVERNVYPIIRYVGPSEHKDGEHTEYTPLFWVPYGRGRFLMCLYQERDPETFRSFLHSAIPRLLSTDFYDS